MNILNIEHISKVFGEKTIFDDASLGIQESEKVGIVGINGMGKTTLLKMIAGEETPDSGQIVKQNGLKIAYLQQNPNLNTQMSILEYVSERNSDENWKVQSILTQLGITDWTPSLSTLSGGQKRKVELAKVLSGDFDVLLLDEPTNHLDDAMISWLEEYLKGFKGTVIMVTHDRYFLDQTTDKILSLIHI